MPYDVVYFIEALTVDHFLSENACLVTSGMVQTENVDCDTEKHQKVVCAGFCN